MRTACRASLVRLVAVRDSPPTPKVATHTARRSTRRTAAKPSAPHARMRSRRDPRPDQRPVDRRAVGRRAPRRRPRSRDGDGYVIRRPGARVRHAHDGRLRPARRRRRARRSSPTRTCSRSATSPPSTAARSREHHSHQSGRDADIGLFYKHKPRRLPGVLRPRDRGRTSTARRPTRCSAASRARRPRRRRADDLPRLRRAAPALRLGEGARRRSRRSSTASFQYPHGRVAAALVHHEPNHDNHIHVRFKCTHSDPACH